MAYCCPPAPQHCSKVTNTCSAWEHTPSPISCHSLSVFYISAPSQTREHPKLKDQWRHVHSKKWSLEDSMLSCQVPELSPNTRIKHWTTAFPAALVEESPAASTEQNTPSTPWYHKPLLDTAMGSLPRDWCHLEQLQHERLKIAVA